MSISLFLLGVIFLGYAYTLDPFQNMALFESEYAKLNNGQTQEYFKLRNELLTPKYSLENYGVTLIIFSFIILVVKFKGFKNLSSPKTTIRMVFIAILLPFATIFSLYFDLMLSMYRNELPHWADSLGIPMMALYPLFIFQSIWVLIHLCFLKANYSRKNLFLAFSKKSNLWLKILIIFSLFYLIINFLLGLYWFLIPSLMWIYFYSSLAASRIQATNEQRKI